MDLTSFQVLVLTISAIVSTFLGVLVYAKNTRSFTGKVFLALCVTTTVWLFFSHNSFYNTSNLFWIRATFSLSVLHNFLFFLLAYALPEDSISSRKKYTIISLFFLTLSVMVLSGSPLTIKDVLTDGNGQGVSGGSGLLVFSIFVAIFSIFTISILAKKMTEAKGVFHKRRYLFVLLGISTMIGLIIFTVTLPTLLFGFGDFVKLIPIYTLVFLTFTAIAIVKYHLFDIKILATKLFVFLLYLIFFTRFILSFQNGDYVEHGLIFLAVLVLGVMLIKSINKEIKTREEERDEMKKLATVLETENKDLQELAKKTQFLTVAAHHFRTPLSVAGGYVELLQDGAFGVIPGSAREVLGRLQTNNDLMTGLVEEFLEAARIELGEMVYQWEKTSISQILGKSMGELGGVFEDFSISTVGSGLERAIVVDEKKLVYCLNAFLRNAFMYTPNQKVSLKVEEKDGGVEVRIIDKGIGISQGEKKHLFEKFFRSEEAQKKNPNGIGLSLFISKHIIEAHNGNTWVKSGGPGKGAEFGFWIPGDIDEGGGVAE